MVEMSVLGISLQEEGSTPLLLLHPSGTQRILTLRIGSIEAFAISTALHWGDKEHPAMRGLSETAGQQQPHAAREASADGYATQSLTHDLLLRAVRALGGTLRAVDLVAFEGSTLLTDAVFAHSGGLRRVPCRVSDGVALALRCGAAIRAYDAVLAHAEEIDRVMARLPESVRSIAQTKLETLRPGPQRRSFSDIPPVVEAALAAKARALRGGDYEAIISVARKMLEDEDTRQREKQNPDSGSQSLPAEADTPGNPRSLDNPGATVIPVSHESGSQQIKIQPARISVPRVKAKWNSGLLDEGWHPAKDIKDILASLGVSGKEAETVRGAADTERWAALLLVLSPATKMLM